MPILRVFPRRTNATPLDDYVAIGAPGLFIPEDISEIHISVTFTYDLEQAEILAEQWQRYGNVSEDWRKFQRQWARPAAIYSKNRIDPLTQMKGDFK